MNYIQQAFSVLHDWWRYLIGLMIIFIFWQVIGMIPLLIFLGIEIINGADASAVSDMTQMSSLLGNNLFLFLMLFSFAVGLAGIIFTSKFLHKQSFLNLTTARPKIDWKRFWFVFIIWGVFSIGTTFISYYLAPEDYIFSLNLKPFIILCVIVILFIPLQTSFEEYLLRGYLMQGFGVILKNRWAPLLITSVIFGLLHGLNPEVDKLGPIMMVFYIGTGLLLGIMTLMDDGLELALGFHAANNIFTALLVTSDWSALQTDALLTSIADPTEMAVSEIVAPVLIVYPILLLILSKKYGWTNWKEKLTGKVIEPPKEDYKIIE
ncbi:CPBP family intramembrane metalloprotease [Winogradskyella undariae]|uniref:CPBP family intramembrane glutamic endopeptidase n=1 Tax=Winogradskyella TaxID=286104 RepID=UPI00156AB180|nr:MULTISPECIES: CPBP family intramembrane glutamic endopeptidase [Winogradskyella]NRR92631.1 CPBP family intramembrane metalloprotease [Winogradskyella undariae]QXP78949.1 CPBP family intramembrane metalloprotease [Winogradskyella sp. HaHa_3_26]